MKTKILFLGLLLSFMFGFGQKSDWSEWQELDEPCCYKGIQVSVKNIGYDESTNKYWWNVRWKNNYNEPISFYGEVVIDGENSLHGRFGTIKPGGIETYTSLPYSSNSKQWIVNVNKVCFAKSSLGCSESLEGYPRYGECDNGSPNYKINEKNKGTVKVKKQSSGYNFKDEIVEKVLNGKKYLETYKSGKKIESKWFDIQTGKLMGCNYYDDEELKETIRYYENGNIYSHDLFKNGKIYSKYYDRQGNLNRQEENEH